MLHLKPKDKFQGTWLEREGFSYCYPLNNTPRIGLRVHVIEWKDGETLINLIKGDGRKIDFKEYKTNTIQSNSKEEIKKIVREYLDFCIENNLTNWKLENAVIE